MKAMMLHFAITGQRSLILPQDPMDSWKALKAVLSPVNPPSDHRHNLSNLEGSVMENMIRNPRATNWDSFHRDLKGRLEEGPPMNMKDQARL